MADALELQLLQVLTVALGAPGVTGVIARVEARLQGRRGPRVLQPYYDLAKLFRKEALALLAGGRRGGADSYTAFGYANPTRRVLAGSCTLRPNSARS